MVGGYRPFWPIDAGRVRRSPSHCLQTYYRWKRDYAGASTDQMKKLRQLERENSELKKIVAEQTLDIRVLKDVAEGNF